MLNFYVYILKCNDDSYYVGHTDDLERRLTEYASGDKFVGYYVATRLPVVCVYSESFATRAEALDAERRLKGWSRKKKEALINGGWQAVKGIWKQK